MEVLDEGMDSMKLQGCVICGRYWVSRLLTSINNNDTFQRKEYYWFQVLQHFGTHSLNIPFPDLECLNHITFQAELLLSRITILAYDKQLPYALIEVRLGRSNWLVFHS